MACASFCVKNIFAIHLYMSNQFAKISFPVQTGLGIWLSFRTYYYIFKSEEDLTSFAFMLRSEISYMCLIFDSVNTFDGSHNTG